MDNMAKPYLDYLDKEMTIMGILSAFCAGGVGLIVKQVFLVEVEPPGRLFYSAGLSLLLAATGFFYWQRSLLAWHYGQLSLWATDQETSGQTLKELLKQCDTWIGWIPYQVGLALTVGSFVEFAGALLPGALAWEMWCALFIALGTLAIAATFALMRVRRDRIEAIEPKRRSRRRLRAVRKAASST